MKTLNNKIIVDIWSIKKVDPKKVISRTMVWKEVIPQNHFCSPEKLSVNSS